MRTMSMIMALAVFLIISGAAYAEEGGMHHKTAGDAVVSGMEESAVMVNNKVCPVSNEEVGKMGPVVQYEYEGKVYNLCCSGCVSAFKKDPEKYVKAVEDQMKIKE